MLELVQLLVKPETYDKWAPVLVPAASLAIILLFLLPVVATVFPMFAIWLERKVSAHMQSRLGPMEVGYHGWLQTIADGVKLLAKEDIIPGGADKALFVIGPVITLAGVFVMLAVLPLGPHLIPADLNVGLFFLAAVGSIEVLGILMSGWASNNKWSLFGTIRLATQLVSYEVPLGVSFVTVTALAGSLSMQEIVREQHGWIWNWFVFRNPLMPLVFIIFYIASLAENKRAPFDLPEAESELVAGFHTEYSGMRFSIFFLAEYVAMYVVSAIGACIFLGGWHTGIGPLDHFLQGSRGGWGGEAVSLKVALLANVIGVSVVFAKAWFLIFVQMWLRWTLPRIRLDQVMDLCLKFLLPASVVFFVASVAWEVVPWEQLCRSLPLAERLPRAIVFAFYSSLVGLWFKWFWSTFQVPLQRSVQEKPWVTSGAFTT
ncbi:NADH-quinone oxidoreductase subunit NuoH [bacterium]|nr:NADH-quinone oxidoreductase subunit NuoH [bacterium]